MMLEPSRRTSAWPIWESGGLGFDLGAGASAARVADETGAGELEAGVEHVHEFVLILGLHEGDAGDAAEVGDIEEAVVRGAVGGERPARSIQKVTGRFWSATSWMTWS